jgi:hypothetical protein
VTVVTEPRALALGSYFRSGNFQQRTLHDALRASGTASLRGMCTCALMGAGVDVILPFEKGWEPCRSNSTDRSIEPPTVR